MVQSSQELKHKARHPRPEREIRIVIDVESLIDNLSKLNIPAEEEALAASERATPAEEPGLAHKVTTFLCLLILTLHPAVWNRRRGVLRQREGRVRTEANAREREPEAPGTEINVEEDSATTEAERTERESVARSAGNWWLSMQGGPGGCKHM